MAKKEQRQDDAPVYDLEGAIRARVIDEEKGLRLISGIYAVRLRGKDSNFLIMEDYLPTLGAIDGSVTFLTREEEYRFDGVKGFYKLQHNEFTLLLKEKSTPIVTAVAGEEEKA